MLENGNTRSKKMNEKRISIPENKLVKTIDQHIRLSGCIEKDCKDCNCEALRERVRELEELRIFKQKSEAWDMRTMPT